MRTRTTALAVGTVAAVAGSLTALTFLTSSTTASADLAGSPGSGQSVVDWNARLVSILGTAGAQPAAVHPTRSFAMLQAAEYNAVVLVTHAAPAYHSQLNEPGDARPDVAADQAAHDVLVALYPARKMDLDWQLTTELEAVADGTPKSHGVDVGVAVAQQIIALRGRGRVRDARTGVRRRRTARRLPAHAAEVPRPGVHRLGRRHPLPD